MNQQSQEYTELQYKLQGNPNRISYLENANPNFTQDATVLSYGGSHVTPMTKSKSMSGHVFTTDNFMGPQAMTRQTRAYSQQATRPSNLSNSQMPFKRNGPFTSMASTPLNRSLSAREGQMRRSPSGVTSQRLESVQENGPLHGIGISPSDYVSSLPQEGSYLASTGASLCPTDVYSSHGIPACPSMVSSSSAHETSPMTRQSSSFDNNNNWVLSTPMIPSSSSESMFASVPWHDPSFSMFPAAQSNEKQPIPDHDLLGLGATFAPQGFTQPTFEGMLGSPSGSVPMERSISSTSTSSMRSTNSNLSRRARERNAQVILNGKTEIRPKVSTATLSPHAAKKNKVMMKPSIQARRKHPKVRCDQCDDMPEFKGQHELQRHISAKHSAKVTKFVCRDPATVGLHSDLAPKVPLKGCKSCDKGKLYGAYYNAAAHLRRWHFVPKSRSKGSKGSREEKRGGSAGGHWPPMEDLKVWFDKVTVDADAQNSATPEDAEEGLPVLAQDATGSGMSADTGLEDYETLSPDYEAMHTVAPTMLSAEVSPMSDFMGYTPTDTEPMWFSPETMDTTFDFSQATIGSAYNGVE